MLEIARLDRANDTPRSRRKISNLYRAWRNHVVRLYWISAFFNTNSLHFKREGRS
ncbi:hypothetical protein HMPREF1576_00677 [Gardnerella pickettii JCP7719]|uniref:Uncharacterized protein n=1 Tax=Gardnerella pickettii JCP7719 TaxID=1261061 RepID=S4GXX1_9BIFI|nr:hypothetical protein HMPREF1576_00677 [Gardnerella pickettii JCP7719]